MRPIAKNLVAEAATTGPADQLGKGPAKVKGGACIKNLHVLLKKYKNIAQIASAACEQLTDSYVHIDESGMLRIGSTLYRNVVWLYLRMLQEQLERYCHVFRKSMS